MKKVCVTLFCGLLALAAFSSLPVRPAHALPEFNKEFQLKYVGAANTDAEKKLAAATTTAKLKCNVCHGQNAMGKDDKKVHNEYGQAVKKFLHKKDKKDVAKIQKALAEVEAMKNGDGKTFGESLKAGELPCPPAPANTSTAK